MSRHPRDPGFRTLIGLLLGLLFAIAAAAPPAFARSVKEPEPLPRLDKTGVVVPWEDFRKLIEEIRKVDPPVKPPPPPVDFALSSCAATATVDGEQQQVQVRLVFSIQVLEEEQWVEVPVLAAGVALSSFTIDGRPADVYTRNNSHNVALRGAGRHELVVEYLVPVSDSRGSRTTRLRFPQAPVITLDLTVPHPGLDFHLGAAVARSIERGSRSTRVRAAFQQAQDASVTWFKQVALDEKETKIFGELHTLLSVGEGVLRGTTNALFTVHGKGTDEFRIALPDGVTVLDVSAQGIRDWSADPDEDTKGKVLTVRLNYLAQGPYSFQISFELPLAGSTAEARVPDFTILDVLRDKGFIAVAAATNVEINPAGELENATPVDPAELPAGLTGSAAQPILYGFKYLRHPVRVALSVVKHDDLEVKRTIVESAHLFTYLSPEGKRLTSARYRVKNNRKQYLEVMLPEGGEGWGAYLEGRPVKAARNGEGKILIPLKKTALGPAGELQAFDVELVYYESRPARLWGRHRFAGPVLDVDAMEVQWHVFLPRDRRYHGFDGNLHPDVELNRILYLGTAAYNLESNDDLSLLRAEQRAGHTVITDGKNELKLGDARLEVGRDEAELGAKDLERLRAIGYVGGDDPVPAEQAPLLEGGERERRNKLESELQQLKKRQVGKEERADRDFEPQAQSNVAGFAGDYFSHGGGKARGVLPVRFAIPVDGLRMSFTGRILTATEEPVVTIDYRPSHWVLSGTAVLGLGFVLALAILLAVGSTRSMPFKLAVAVPCAFALAGLFVMSNGSRRALLLGVLLALAAAVVARLLKTRRAVPQAAMTLLLGVLLVGLLSAAPANAKEAVAVAPGAGPQLPDLTGTEITLSWNDFRNLVARMHVPPPVDPEPPAAAFLRSAEYRGRLERGILTLDGTLTLEVLKRGWAKVPLGSQGTVIDFQGGGALLNRNGAGLEVLAQGPATYTLKTTVAFAATDHPGENRLALKLPDAPRNLIDLSYAADFRDVAVESGLAYSTRGGRTYVSLTNGAFAMKYTLPFQQAEEQAGEEIELEPRVQLSTYQLLNLGDGVLSGVLVHDYQVRVAKLAHFDIDLPDGIAIFDCVAPGLENWKILQRDGQRYLRVKLLAPTDGGVRVVVYFEGAYDPDEGRVGVPRFPPLDVERESGFVAVAAEGAEVELALSGNLLPADVSELPVDVRAYGGNLIGACKYSGQPDAASVTVIEHEDAPVLTAIVESLNATAALLENGTEATWIDLAVKNNRKQFLRFTVPGEDVEVWSLLLDGEPAKPKRTGNEILVPLPRGNGEVASRISLVLLRKGSPVRSFGQLTPYLPSFDVPVSEALWTVYLPEGRKYVTRGDDFRPVVVTDPLMPRRGVALGQLGRVARKVAAPEASVYADAVSEETAESQVRQEADIRQQMMQKGSARKGALPVRIAIPGGVGRLPQVTVSRMLIVGDEPNTFPIRVYPGWITPALMWLQLLALLGSALLSGLLMAGLLPRRRLPWVVLLGFVGLLPFGGLGPAGALLLLSAGALATRIAVAVYRYLAGQQPRAVEM